MHRILLIIPLILFVGCNETTPSSIHSPVDTSGNEPSSTQTEKQKAVLRHNEIRAEKFLGASMVWSTEIALSAQSYADSLAKSGKWEHDSHANNPYGENLFAASYQVNYLDAINSWYKEKPYYNYTNNSCQSGKVCGHYTQMIWKDSTELGCGVAKYERGSRKGWLVIVCRYNPPGNYIGRKPY